MNQVKLDFLKVSISTILIIVAFFLGYILATQKQKYSLEDIQKEKKYIEIQTKKNSITITKKDPQIEILVNGTPSSSGSISLE